MLVLTRKVGERIQIGDDIIVSVIRVQNGKVRIGIEAPDHVRVRRDELNVNDLDAGPKSLMDRHLSHDAIETGSLNARFFTAR